MDLAEFLKWEKDLIREERQRLDEIVENAEIDVNIKDMCSDSAKQSAGSKKQMNFHGNEVKNDESSNCHLNCGPQVSDRNTISSSSINIEKRENVVMQCSVISEPETLTLETDKPNPVELSNEIFSLYTSYPPELESENAAAFINEEKSRQLLSKKAKNVANEQAALSIHNVALTGTLSNERRKHEKDDMEQWVTDTFYSYFPGYNDELQKRQRYLRERQLENQQNLLRHQLEHPPLPKKALHRSKQFNVMDQTVNTARSSATSTSNTTNTSTTISHPPKKTDLEIIVNNPGYVPPKPYVSRPSTTRNKLLQDLCHTEIVDGDGVIERNRHSAEVESARKKDYQRELMKQIEEKRRSIEILREKERHQDEVLTRRLQEQLKTIQLEEQLEKEKIRAEKIRFDSEQNRLAREQLLAKLENDSRLLNSNTRSNCDNSPLNKIDNIPNTATTADVAATCDVENNRVYKYFSNSARHEYRRGKPFPEDLELDLAIPTLKSVRDEGELECFHLSEKVCPMCDGPLKNYESCCLRCQKKLSLRIQSEYDGNVANEKNLKDDIIANAGKEYESYSMVCEKCERLYVLCPTCISQKDVCRACHRKRNVCLNCRRTLCSRCLDEIASGRDIERTHINEIPDAEKTHKKDVDSVRSFQVLEVNYSASPEYNNNTATQPVYPNDNVTNNVDINHSESMESPQRLPYSINIEKNSIFHPEYKPLNQKNLTEEFGATSSDDKFNIERIRKDTDKRLSRYLRNYGDLAVNPRMRSKSESGNDRSTQTTPNTSYRRDIVMHEEHNLSMPLLREMPKMTRTESDRMLLNKPSYTISSRIQQLKRRWEVPAVQKFTISATSPKVLTQVGAIKKQLQADHLMRDSS